MSDIVGEGYGASHNWKKVYTAQVGAANPSEKVSFYICEDCEERFIHYYDAVPDIFTAMKDRKIAPYCTNIKQNS